MRTCLVVDDSSVIRKVARRILEGLDFQIIEAEDGEKALTELRMRPYDLVISDLRMPRLSGREFYEELVRRVEALPSVVAAGASRALARQSPGRLRQMLRAGTKSTRRARARRKAHAPARLSSRDRSRAK